MPSFEDLIKERARSTRELIQSLAELERNLETLRSAFKGHRDYCIETRKLLESLDRRHKRLEKLFPKWRR